VTDNNARLAETRETRAELFHDKGGEGAQR
jgi:hypothetical protein